MNKFTGADSNKQGAWHTPQLWLLAVADTAANAGNVTGPETSQFDSGGATS